MPSSIITNNRNGYFPRFYHGRLAIYARPYPFFHLNAGGTLLDCVWDDTEKLLGLDQNFGVAPGDQICHLLLVGLVT